MYSYQQEQIREAQTDAMKANTKVDEFSNRVREMEVTINRMALACQAMWEVLRARTGITEQELLDKMHEVDLRDGKADGKMTPVIINCPACGKPSNSRHSQCMYCGAAIPRPHVFQM